MSATASRSTAIRSASSSTPRGSAFSTGARLPQLHLRQIRRRNPQVAGACSPGRCSTRRPCTCCATNTASRAPPRKRPTRWRRWPSGLKASIRRACSTPCGRSTRRPAPMCRSTPISTTGCAPRAWRIYKSNWAQRLDQPPYEAYGVTDRHHLHLRWPQDRQRRGGGGRDRRGHPRPLRRRRNRRRALLPQLRERHRVDGRRRVRPHRRPQRRRLRAADLEERRLFSAASDSPAATGRRAGSAFGTEVDDPVGGLDDFEVVLDDEHGIAPLRRYAGKRRFGL